MWLSEKRAGNNKENGGESCVGVVTIGGVNPSVLTDGELRNAEIVCSGAVRIPKTGDEMLVIKSPDGEVVAVGKTGVKAPEEVQNGEVYITTEGGGLILLKNNGEIKLSGNVIITGTTKIEGTLLINGVPCRPSAES